MAWQVRASYANIRFKHDLPIAGELEAYSPDPLASARLLSTRDKRTDFYSLGVVYDQGPWQIQFMLNRIEQGNQALVDLVEVMACPGGCIGGGGQPVPVDASIRQKRREAIFNCDRTSELRKSHENPEIKTLYDTWLGKPLSEKAHSLLHTHYHAQNR